MHAFKLWEVQSHYIFYTVMNFVDWFYIIAGSELHWLIWRKNWASFLIEFIWGLSFIDWFYIRSQHHDWFHDFEGSELAAWLRCDRTGRLNFTDWLHDLNFWLQGLDWLITRSELNWLIAWLQGLNLPPGYVVIELDDGDSRDFHIDSIRILPPDYPIVGKSEIRILEINIQQ